eukprot:755831-Hanusia_phi.AAC.2
MSGSRSRSRSRSVRVGCEGGVAVAVYRREVVGVGGVSVGGVGGVSGWGLARDQFNCWSLRRRVSPAMAEKLPSARCASSPSLSARTCHRAPHAIPSSRPCCSSPLL